MKTSFILFQTLLAASAASAQEVLAEVFCYNADDCGADANNPDLISSSITVFKDVSEIKVENGQRNGACMKKNWVVDGWPTNSGGEYDVRIDNNDVPEGCELVFYKDIPAGAGTSGKENCVTFYRRVPNANSCTTITMGKEFGYAMCCGEENCSFAAKNNPFQEGSKQERIMSPSPRGFTRSCTPRSKKIRDVTSVKRSPLGRRQDGCEFAADDGSTKSSILYTDQTVISNTYNCPGSEPCQLNFDISYSVSVTNTFGVEASIGGDLFKAITGSITFSYQYSKEKSTSWSEGYVQTVPAGASGYMTFQAQVECSPTGKFNDKCTAGDLAEKSGRACFPTYNGDKPYGIFTFVQTN